tara:strand:+ start:197 stop:511 length:315 start_codon:yes stop_codon:yes gene_type:complete
MGNIDFDKFKVLYNEFYSIPTWTKIKHSRLSILMDYLMKHEHVTITFQNKNFPLKGIWDYDLFEVPNNIRGKLYKWRDKKVLRMCINYEMYSRDKLICCPIKQS